MLFFPSLFLISDRRKKNGGWGGKVKNKAIDKKQSSHTFRDSVFIQVRIIKQKVKRKINQEAKIRGNIKKFKQKFRKKRPVILLHKGGGGGGRVFEG